MFRKRPTQTHKHFGSCTQPFWKGIVIDHKFMVFFLFFSAMLRKKKAWCMGLSFGSSCAGLYMEGLVLCMETVPFAFPRTPLWSWHSYTKKSILVISEPWVLLWLLIKSTIHNVQADGSELINFVTTYSQTQTTLVSHCNHHDKVLKKGLPCGKAQHTSQTMQMHGENYHPPRSHKPQLVMCPILKIKLGLWESSLPTDYRRKTLGKSD